MSIRAGFAVGVGCSVVLVAVLFAVPAHAEPKANVPVSGAAEVPPPAPAGPSAPDIVRLKNGGMLRGTIAESNPGEFVMILLVTGESRKIAAADVVYAGPAESAPAAAPAPVPAPSPVPAQAPAVTPNANEGHRPFVTVEGPEAKVQFESTPSTLTLHRRSASAGITGHGGVISGYDEICTAPCRVSLPAGTYTFAVSKPSKNAVEAEPVTLPAGTSVLRADYTDRSGLRVGGWVVLIGSLGVGFGLEVDSFSSGTKTCDDYGYCSSSMNTTELAVGLGIAAVGFGVGFALLRSPDNVAFTVGAGSGSAPSALGHATKELATAGRGERSLPGLHVGLAF